ncbi:hypothetical protein F7Q99_39150 [Streptomyces kaniharaensis]|uniref:Uncharacterized protein n=1 Tax=Streptomyces kaniharaensis TaxID=212423 RepID=A0A6N7L2N0_9ACTN|nr:hypothetical protein [Streptomyces kaniharaensis]MQS18050.1 hypothetical protein [Streptomyces kaniharaensis]
MAAGVGPQGWRLHREKLKEARRAHLELCAKYMPRNGGIPDTIAEIHMAWVVGAHVLGEAIGVPGLGEAAERAAAERLKAAIEAAAETNVPEGELLWRALDAMRLDVAAFRRWRSCPGPLLAGSSARVSTASTGTASRSGGCWTRW